MDLIWIEEIPFEESAVGSRIEGKGWVLGRKRIRLCDVSEGGKCSGHSETMGTPVLSPGATKQLAVSLDTETADRMCEAL